MFVNHLFWWWFAKSTQKINCYHVYSWYAGYRAIKLKIFACILQMSDGYKKEAKSSLPWPQAWCVCNKINILNVAPLSIVFWCIGAKHLFVIDNRATWYLLCLFHVFSFVIQFVKQIKSYRKTTWSYRVHKSVNGLWNIQKALGGYLMRDLRIIVWFPKQCKTPQHDYSGQIFATKEH